MTNETEERPGASQEPEEETPAPGVMPAGQAAAGEDQPAEPAEEEPAEAAEEQPDEPAEEQPAEAPVEGQQSDIGSGTISLLDLMAEEEAARESKPRPEPPADPDEATPTAMPIPTDPPRLQRAPPLPPISRDKTLPARPPELDENATRVDPGLAFPGSTDPRFARRPPEPRSRQPTQRPARRGRPVQERQTARHQLPARAPVREPSRRPPPPPPRVIPARGTYPPPAPAARRRSTGSCFLRLVLLGLLATIVAFALAGVAAVIGYTAIARDLPDVAELERQVSDFETALIFDREGNQLYSLSDPSMGSRTYVTLDQISPHLINATIATEDSRFYTNPGFDPIGIARAITQAALEREIVSGASTITQQLVRASLLDEDERAQITFRRKVREIILAEELSRKVDKDKILELYLNEIFYGNFAYGIEAAARTYFGKPASDLELHEASLLAGLPQAPALWDPYTAPELALARQSQVLGLMVEENYITFQEAEQAMAISAEVIRNLRPPERRIENPHFVFAMLQQLEELLGAQSLYAGGLRIYTTLDPAAQQIALAAVAEHRDLIYASGANNAALVAIRPDTGEVLAMVGSLDYRNEEIRGQVNMALAPRQPGSSIKPLVYAAAMAEGWSPATLIWDVETEFPDGANPPYVPKNFDDEFHGPVRLRPALGNSYNIPAVKALEYVGVCRFLQFLPRVGINLVDEGCLDAGTPRDYGLALALGGGGVSPLRLTAAFAALANEGHYVTPSTILRIENRRGELLFENVLPERAVPAERAIAPAHAYLLADILADNEARQPEFGVNNNLVIPGHQVAAKTGTSGTTRFDVRDGWTLGFTPQIAAGVWVGNTDPEPVAEGMSGYRMASPIWNAFMTRYLAGEPAAGFVQPNSVIALEICATSGTRPGPDCERTIAEYFAVDQPPPPAEDDFIQRLPVDLWTGLRANEFCTEDVYEAGFVNLRVSGRDDVVPRELRNARAWVEETAAGRAWADALSVPVPLRLPPDEECTPATERPLAAITHPVAGSQLLGDVPIFGSAQAPNFAGYILDFGFSHDPGGWAPADEPRAVPVSNGQLGLWQTSRTSYAGPITLRLTVFGPDNPYTEGEDRVTAEARVLLELQQPTPTPTPTSTATPTPTPTATPTTTATPTSTIAPTETPTITLTPTPTATAEPEATETPSPTSESPNP